MKNAISIGAIYVTLSYSNKVTKSFTDVADMIEALNLFRESFKRLDNLLILTTEDVKNKEKKKLIDKTIRFENVNIIVNDTVILKNLNFIIPEGKK